MTGQRAVNNGGMVAGVIVDGAVGAASTNDLDRQERGP